MRRFCQGDAAAFNALFDRYSRPIHAYLVRMLSSPSTAEDVSQATFLSLVRARGRFQAGARVRPWIYAIATNAARDFLRRRREEVTSDGELPITETVDGPSRDIGLERAVQTALAQLPEQQREAILLHRFEGLSFSEIAETLGVSESAVKVRAHRGYERLRVLLAQLKDSA